MRPTRSPILTTLAAAALTLAAACGPLEPGEGDLDDLDALEEEARAEQGLTINSTAMLQLTYIKGRLGMVPDYRLTDGTPAGGRGQIPGSLTRFRYAYVCAFDQDGLHDFASGGTDDDLIGCARADRNGDYAIFVPDAAQDDVYLLTFFCDNPDDASLFDGDYAGDARTKSAEVCVRLNRNLRDASWRRARKYLWSRTYWNALTAHATTYINWNVSCPNRDGLASGRTTLGCAASGVDAPEPTATGSTNSNAAFNKEAVHLFRAGIEPIKTFGSLKPRSFNVSGTPCSHARCQGQINLVIWAATVGSDAAQCDMSSGVPANLNTSSDYDISCITNGGGGDHGTLNPFRPVHEMGHNIHRRWMKDSSALFNGGSSTGWATGASETVQLAEGWANFVASASWFNSDDNSVIYDTFGSVQNKTNPNLAGACPAGGSHVTGEGHATQFFWDLWDDDDTIKLSFHDLLRTWSRFPVSSGDGGSDECSPLGRNAYDFRDHFEELGFDAVGSGFWAMMSYNCLDRHYDGLAYGCE